MIVHYNVRVLNLCRATVQYTQSRLTVGKLTVGSEDR